MPKFIEEDIDLILNEEFISSLLYILQTYPVSEGSSMSSHVCICLRASRSYCTWRCDSRQVHHKEAENVVTFMWSWLDSGPLPHDRNYGNPTSYLGHICPHVYIILISVISASILLFVVTVAQRMPSYFLQSWFCVVMIVYYTVIPWVVAPWSYSVLTTFNT